MLEEVTEKGTSDSSVKMLFVRFRKIVDETGNQMESPKGRGESDGVTEGERGIRWSHRRGEGKMKEKGMREGGREDNFSVNQRCSTEF